MSNLDKYREDLGKLLDLGSRMLNDLTLRHQATSSSLSAEQKEAAKKLEGYVRS